MEVKPLHFNCAFDGKRVLVTGHTGFKGSWLCEWLLGLGAQVTGFSLPGDGSGPLFTQLGLGSRIDDVRGDVRDLEALCRLVAQLKPDFLFHLAAQPLVRLSYEKPVDTYSVNVMGTVNILEAVRMGNFPCAIVAVTTDKCYENREWVHSYREDDALGGYDPYSSSKGAAEIVIAAYRRSYFSGAGSRVKLASARAGNVVGGGDWALDRILPDCIRALQLGRPIPVRNKIATRPWQHVLEPLSGYLWLAACLAQPSLSAIPNDVASSFNFGPALTSNQSVAAVVKEVLRHWPGSWSDQSDPGAVHEAKLLNLATDKAYHFLGWKPVWGFEATIAKTIAWYRTALERDSNACGYTQTQIAEFANDARALGLRWSRN